MCQFSEFYNKHKDKLFGYLLRRTGDPYLSKDIVQESFTRYLEAYGGKACNTTLLFVIARNLLVDHHRSDKPRVLFSENHRDQRNPEDHLIVREEYRRILCAMEKLDVTERDLMALVVGSRISYFEIAEITGYSVSNVKIKVHRARAKLRQLLEEADSETFLNHPSQRQQKIDRGAVRDVKKL
ncbi:MAG: RNA polymerase sigma factor [Thermodesulfobacteriota bacterium]